MAPLAFQVITDHKNLEYIKGANRPNAREARRWSLFFTCFQFSNSPSLTSLTERTARPALSLEGKIPLMHSHKMVLVYHHLLSLPHQLGYYGINIESTPDRPCPTRMPTEQTQCTSSTTSENKSVDTHLPQHWTPRYLQDNLTASRHRLRSRTPVYLQSLAGLLQII